LKRKELYKVENEEAYRTRVAAVTKEATAVLASESAKKFAGLTKEHRTPTVLTGIGSNGRE
jgi:hypothetical protein